MKNLIIIALILVVVYLKYCPSAQEVDSPPKQLIENLEPVESAKVIIENPAEETHLGEVLAHSLENCETEGVVHALIVKFSDGTVETIVLPSWDEMIIEIESTRVSGDIDSRLTAIAWLKQLIDDIIEAGAVAIQIVHLPVSEQA